MCQPGKNVKSVDFRNGFPSITSSGTTIPGSSAETCTGLAAVRELPDELHRDPAAREARQRDGVEPQREELARRGGVQHRHAVPHERVVVLVGHGRALRLVVLAGQDHHRSVPAGAGEVPDSLSASPAPVDAGPLPVPEAHDPVVAGVRIAVEHLGAGERRGGELLVRAGDVADVVLGKDLPCLAQREIVPPSGEPGYPLMKVPIRRPARRSRRL